MIKEKGLMQLLGVTTEQIDAAIMLDMGMIASFYCLPIVVGSGEGYEAYLTHCKARLEKQGFDTENIERTNNIMKTIGAAWDKKSLIDEVETLKQKVEMLENKLNSEQHGK